MGNLAELFISFILASGQWAGPIQQGSVPDANASIQGPTPPAAKPFGLSPGDRVRFSAAKEQPITEGNVVAADPEALLLRVRGVDEPVRIPWSSLRRLEAYRGQHSLAGRGARIGALSLGISLAAGSFLAATSRGCGGWRECSADSFVGGAVGAGIGGGAGALIGDMFKIERWDQRIPPTAKAFGLSPGDSVRFSIAEGQPITEGTVVAADPEALLLRVRGVDEPVRIPWSSLRRLEVNRGRHSLADRGAKIGALSVGIPFAAISFLAAAFRACAGWECSAAAFGGGAVGAGIGVLVGASIGDIFKIERWDEVDLPPIRVRVTPQRGGGLAVAVSLRF